jgi:hypothetical protein
MLNWCFGPGIRSVVTRKCSEQRGYNGDKLASFFHIGCSGFEDEKGCLGVDAAVTIISLILTTFRLSYCVIVDLRKHFVILRLSYLCDRFLQNHTNGVDNNVDLAKIFYHILEQLVDCGSRGQISSIESHFGVRILFLECFMELHSILLGLWGVVMEC